MRLHWHRGERLRRRYVDYRCTRTLEMLENGSARIECAKKIDVDNRLESIRRHSQHGSRKVSGGSTHHDIDLAELLAGGGDCRCERPIITHVSRKSGCRSAIFGDAPGGSVELLLRPANQRQLRPMLGETFRNCEVDPASPTGHESDFVPELPWLKYGCHSASSRLIVCVSALCVSCVCVLRASCALTPTSPDHRIVSSAVQFAQRSC